jgi:hypothetical protein
LAIVSAKTVLIVARSVASSAAVGVADAVPAGVALAALVAVDDVFAAVGLGVVVVLSPPPHAADRRRSPTNAAPRRANTFLMMTTSLGLLA